ncbi:uncharacterized protein LOC117333139 isoform X2 [Pecten maximus]|uniref:uncharacterized protein LOC117333139 isoform X2 n=1 Tax=Pecten maximus TaxID=6579 RepID=UPI0014585B49|nr:uncharacterized protein LOC117333139 isoform X2 [Pecten maximus]
MEASDMSISEKGEALGKAAKNGDVDIVKMLLEKGADPNKGGALMYAAEEGHKHIVTLLIDKGADIKKWDVLAYAARNGHKDVVSLLLDKGSDVTGSDALGTAALYGYIDIVSMLLDRALDADKSNALREAARYGHEDIVALLLERGADPDKDDALTEAASVPNKNIMTLLLDKGADIKKSRALREAAIHGDEDIVTMLLERGANSDKGDPLAAAASRCNKNMVTLLLDNGADIKKSNALREAARYGHEDVVTMLVERRADPDKLMIGDVLPNYKKGVTKIIEKKQEQVRQQQQEYTAGIKTNVENPCNITITVVGHKGVGKSCFVKQIKQESIPKGGPNSTDTADFYVNYMGYNPKTGFRKRIDDNGEIETGRHRLKRIIDRYRKGGKTDTRDYKSTQGRHTGEMKELSPMVSSPSSLPLPAPSEAKKAKKTDASSEQRNVIAETKPIAALLSPEQRNVIDDVMHTKTDGVEELKGFVTLYDFGGEKVFYNTHHCFMSSNMVFVLVVDVEMCLDQSRSEVGYEIAGDWLRNIATYANDDAAHDKLTPPIILVGSHLDKVSSDKEEQEKLFANVLEKLREVPQLKQIIDSHVQEAFPIANLNDSTKNQEVYEIIWKKILEVAPLQSQWEKPVPAKWVALEHELVRLKNRGGIILSYEELLNLNRQLTVPLEEQEMVDFLRNLKFTGTFHCFDLHGKNPFIVLQPQWTIDAFKAIITDSNFKSNLTSMARLKWAQYEKSGVLPMAFVKQLWEENRFADYIGKLFIVMETLNLLAKPISDDPDVEADYFIVPCMLQTANPHMIQQLLDDPDTVTTVTLCLKFNNPFIPQAVWDKMIASFIHRFKRLHEYGYDGSQFIQRGFVCLSVDFLWNIVINCRDNAMKIIMFKKDKEKSTRGAGVDLLCILEFLLQRILEQNHQSHLKYEFYLHNDYRFASNDKMAMVDKLRHVQGMECFSSKSCKWIKREYMYDWFEDPDQGKMTCNELHNEGTADLPDRKLTYKEIGRISGYIGMAYQVFFVTLGCPAVVLEQEREEHRHLAFRSLITKIFLQLLKMKADIRFVPIAKAMTRHGMDATKLSNIIDCNRKIVFEDGRLTKSRLQENVLVDDASVIAEYIDIKAYFNLFLELGLQPKTVDEFDDQYRHKPARGKIKAMLKDFITETKPRPTVNAIFLAMQECSMDTDSLITAMENK